MAAGIYSEEHRIFRESFRRFAANEVAPNTARWEDDGEVPRNFWLKMGQNGFLCPWLPEEYGGLGVGYQYSVIIAEELIRANGYGVEVPLHSDIVVPYIFSYGTEEIKRKWLPKCASGEAVSAIALTEPDAGSDLAAIRTRAVRDGEHYRINGSKVFITNGCTADIIVLACKTDPSAGHKGISLILVETDAPGFMRGRKLEKMGSRMQDTAELFFDDCRVPVGNLLGVEGKGFHYMMEKLQQERLDVCIKSQVNAEEALNAALQYAKERKAFGKRIGDFQANAFKLAEMATEVEARADFPRLAYRRFHKRQGHRSKGIDGQILACRNGEPYCLRRSTASRRIRLHERIQSEPDLPGCQGVVHLCRYERNHEVNRGKKDGIEPVVKGIQEEAGNELSRLHRQESHFFPGSRGYYIRGAGMTHKSLWEQANRMANALRSMGVKSGDKVGLFLTNRPEFMVAYFACQKLVAASVSIPARSIREEVQYMINDSESMVLITEPALKDRIPATSEIPMVREFITVDSPGDGNWDTLLAKNSPEFKTIWTDRDIPTPAAILYTSGTTGRPKGAVLTHVNIISNANNSRFLCDVRQEDRSICFLPLYHAFAQNFIAVLAFQAACHPGFGKKLRLEKTLATVRDCRVTRWYSVPAVYLMVLNHPNAEEYMKSVRYCFSASSAMPAEAAKQWESKFGLQIDEGYGMTETSPQICYTQWKRKPRFGRA